MSAEFQFLTGCRTMNVVQFEIPSQGRRVGVVDSDRVVDVTSGDADMRFVVDVFTAAQRTGRSLTEFLGEATAKDSVVRLGGALPKPNAFQNKTGTASTFWMRIDLESRFKPQCDCHVKPTTDQ